MGSVGGPTAKVIPSLDDVRRIPPERRFDLGWVDDLEGVERRETTENKVGQYLVLWEGYCAAELLLIRGAAYVKKMLTSPQPKDFGSCPPLGKRKAAT